NGDGTFGIGPSVSLCGPSQTIPQQTAVADTATNGYRDLVVACARTTQVVSELGLPLGRSPALGAGRVVLASADPQGHYGIRQQVDVGGRLSSITAADLDHRGRADFVVSDMASTAPPRARGEVFVLRRLADGTLSPPTPFEVGGGGEEVVAADLTGSGRMDLVVACMGPQSDFLTSDLGALSRP
ncbi:FG-GAP repeat domain-containing protein, partial [Nocardia gipuzkoensis]